MNIKKRIGLFLTSNFTLCYLLCTMYLIYCIFPVYETIPFSNKWLSILVGSPTDKPLYF